MQADFLDAHDRHCDDAERLFAAARWANADHLYGLAAECGLKALMQKLKGGPLDPKNDYVHVMESKKPSNAWDRFEAYRCGPVDGVKFVLPSQNPFTDWDVSQRYAHQSLFDAARATPHQIGANQVRQLIKKAQREGLI
jgi:hypothetical protein